MSPVPTTPRLAALDPREIAEDVVGRAVEHIARVAFYLHTTDLQISTAPLATSLGLEAAQLTRYAQTGEIDDPRSVMGCMQTVAECLYSQAGIPGTFGGGALDDDADIDDPIGLVLVAAHARQAIDDGHYVSLRGLAALASVAESRVRQLAATREIRVSDGRITARDARRWLAARDVPGYRDPK